MPELDEMLREAADGAAARARGGDFDGMVRGARRRRARVASSGAAALVAVVAIGAAVVVGRPDGATPAPGRLVNPAASASGAADVPVSSLETDIPAMVWSFEKGITAGDLVLTMHKSRKFNRVASGGAGELRKIFPDAPVGGPYLMLTGGLRPAARSEAEQFVAEAGRLAGVRHAELVMLHGYWFTVTVTAERSVPLSPEPPIPAFESGNLEAYAEDQELVDGKYRWTAEYHFVTPTLSDATLLEIRQTAARRWGEGAEATTVTPSAMPPG